MIAVAAWALFAPLVRAAAPRISDALIQIGIVQKASVLRLRPHGLFSIIDQKTGEEHELKDREAYPVEAGRDVLHFGPFLLFGQARLLPQSSGAFIDVGAGRFDGTLLLRRNPDRTITLVQETGIEDYLYGVLAKEMSPRWPAEALKAQAVVARTFALSNLGKFGRAGFDLSMDARSQLYGDLDGRDPDATAAVRATEGEVLYYRGRLLKAFFHACCGGATSNVAAVWGGAPPEPPTQGVRDRYCGASPHMEWKAYFGFADILDALNRNGRFAARLKGLGRGRTDRSGRLETLLFYTDAGRLEVRANDFRGWLGPEELKSTRILRIVRRHRGYEFYGRGFGHGVGLCQWGARAMADKGKTYRQILSYYFPGAQLRRIDE